MNEYQILDRAIDACRGVIDTVILPYLGTAEFSERDEIRVEFGLVPIPRRLKEMQAGLPPSCSVQVEHDPSVGPRLVFTIPYHSPPMRLEHEDIDGV